MPCIWHQFGADWVTGDTPQSVAGGTRDRSEFGSERTERPDHERRPSSGGSRTDSLRRELPNPSRSSSAARLSRPDSISHLDAVSRPDSVLRERERDSGKGGRDREKERLERVFDRELAERGKADKKSSDDPSAFPSSRVREREIEVQVVIRDGTQSPVKQPERLLDGVPLEVQEAWVCEDLMFVLQGLEGSLIRYADGYDPLDSDSRLRGARWSVDPSLGELGSPAALTDSRPIITFARQPPVAACDVLHVGRGEH